MIEEERRSERRIRRLFNYLKQNIAHFTCRKEVKVIQGSDQTELVMNNIELMSVEEICDWLKFNSGKVFEDSILSAVSGRYDCLQREFD